MKKGVAVAIVCVSILLLVSMPIVSANWFDDMLNNIADFFGGDAGITGNPIDEGEDCLNNCEGTAEVIFNDSFEGGFLQAPYLSASNALITIATTGSFANLRVGAPAHTGSKVLAHRSNIYGFSYTTPYENNSEAALASTSEGEVFNASVWVRNQHDNSNLHSVRLFIFALDSNYQEISNNSITVPLVTGDISWQKMTVQMTMPVGAAHVSIRLDNSGNSLFVFWDDLVLTNLNIPSNADDGSDDDGGIEGGNWVCSGTPENFCLPEFSTQETCESFDDYCSWDVVSETCNTNACSFYLTEDNCNSAACTWESSGEDIPDLDDGSFEGGNWVCSGTPENFCLPEFSTQETCESFDDYCSWDVVSETCNTNACSFYLTEDNCNSAACTWESSGEDIPDLDDSSFDNSLCIDPNAINYGSRNGECISGNTPGKGGMECNPGETIDCWVRGVGTGQKICELGLWSSCDIQMFPSCTSPIDGSYNCFVQMQQEFTYLEDYDIDRDGVLTDMDPLLWLADGRTDVAIFLQPLINAEGGLPEPYPLYCNDELNDYPDCIYEGQTYFTYLEDYDLNDDGTLDILDIVAWVDKNRNDVANFLNGVIIFEAYYPISLSYSPSCVFEGGSAYDCFYLNQQVFTYLEDYDLNRNGILDNADIDLWEVQGRTDVSVFLDPIINVESRSIDYIEVNPSNYIAHCNDRVDDSYDCFYLNQQVFTYLEDYDINDDGTLDVLDIVAWVDKNRNDVVYLLAPKIISGNYVPVSNLDNSLGGCTDINANNYEAYFEYEDGSCDWNFPETCDDGKDNDGNGIIDDGCEIFYSINELIFSENTTWENADVSVSCGFNVTSDTEDLTNFQPSLGCVKVSVEGDFDACSFDFEGLGTDNIYYRTFNCDVGSLGLNKELVCAINPGFNCRYGEEDNPSSEAGLINVTTPLTCPAGLGGSSINVGSSIGLGNLDIDMGEDFVFDWRLTTLAPLDNLNITFEAGLYELNLNKELATNNKTIQLSDTLNEVEMVLDVPSVAPDGNHRIYIKSMDENKSKFCILNQYDVNLIELEEDDNRTYGAFGNQSIDLRYLGSNSIEMAASQTIPFTLNGVNEHNVEIKEILESSAIIEIRSNPITLNLSVGESKEVDLENDGISDILVKLIQITGDSVIINLEALESFVICGDGDIRACFNGEGTQFCNNNVWGQCTYNSVEGSEDVVLGYGDDYSSEKSSDFPWVIVTIVGIIILVLIILWVVFKRKFTKKVLGGSSFSKSGPGPRSASPGQHVMRRPVVRRN